MMNRIDALFQKRKPVLSIFATAGFPQINATLPILRALQKAGAGMVEIGIPFSDPLADGPVIQHSSSVALENGMTLEGLFGQLRNIREEIKMPLLLMGYVNTVMQFGMARFLENCQETGIDGVILPDLPPEVFESEYQQMFEKHGINPVFLVTPQSSEARLRKMDALSRGFLYAVSTSATTGERKGFSLEQIAYFDRLQAAGLRNPVVVGFGISSREDLQTVFAHAQGGIIGSAFVRAISKAEEAELEEVVLAFVRSVLPQD
ncbi:MAG: tryptophan synthase subunit alpha [Saprospiraceae bacterium]|nr:tryptophan synthase subunit alpha [Saprospiraceae bacterium]